MTSFTLTCENNSSWPIPNSEKEFFNNLLVKPNNEIYKPLLRYALKRSIAAVVDYGLYFLFVIAYVVFFENRTEDGRFEVKGFTHIFILFFFWFVYFPGLESMLGYTLGKGLFDLKVVTEHGKKPSITQTFERHLLDLLDIVFFAAIAVISVTHTKYPRRLGDMWAHTVVVSDNDKNKSETQVQT